MPYVVDASERFDRAGHRFAAERRDSVGLPERYLRTLYLMRAFVVVDDDGAAGKEWAVFEVTGRISRGTTTEDNQAGREAAISDRVLLTNSGAITAGDAIGSDEGWWRLPVDGGREEWQVVGDPVAVYGAGADTVHHYEVPLRRVDG